jgi:Ni,Fe-hydrogenase maturation factor
VNPTTVLPSTVEAAFATARRVADAVLYEGYVLYPYRRSAPKNQVRWQFGVLVPPAASLLDPSERSSLRARVLLDADDQARLVVLVRCLQLQQRTVQAATGDGRFRAVPQLQGGGGPVLPFDEAVAHEHPIGPVAVGDLLGAPVRWTIVLPGGRDLGAVGLPDGQSAPDVQVGRVVRRRWTVRARVILRAERLSGRAGPVLVEVALENRTRWRVPRVDTASAPNREIPGVSARARWRDLAVRRALLGAHLLLGVAGGDFVSSLDPPDELHGAVRHCDADGVFPALVGGSRRAPAMLLSPIALPEDPQVAPESPGDFFDATEIDELLALRVLTLTDEEKREAAATDPAAARILARCEGLGPEGLQALHGTIRSLRSLGQPPLAGQRQLIEQRSIVDPPPLAGPPPLIEQSSLADEPPLAGPPSLIGLSSLADEPPLAGPPSPPGQPSTQAPEALVAPTDPWWDPGADEAASPGTDVALVGGRPTVAGDRVLLRPNRRADAQDLFLAGRTATVTGVFSDLDGQVHLAVVLDDDPGADLHRWFGRYWYFAPEELERLDDEEPDASAGLSASASSDGGDRGQARPRVLVAGIGNVFLGDDGFGVAVAQALVQRPWPAGVEVQDSGIRGVHLAYQLLDGWDLVVLVDALAGDDPPGTLSVVDLSVPGPEGPGTFGAAQGARAEPGEASAMDAHGMDPDTVLAMAESLGARVGRVVLVGCVPERLVEEIALSDPVAQAVPAACRLVEELVEEAIRDTERGPHDKKEVLR